MIPQQVHLGQCRWLRAVVIAVVALTCGWAIPARADLRQETSLAFAPADADFFAMRLRLKERRDAILQSRAVAKLKTTIAFQAAQAWLQSQWQTSKEPFVVRLREWSELPENQELVEVVKDALSQEMFVYGGPDVGKGLVALTQVSQAINGAQLAALREGREADEQEIAHAVAEAVQEALADFKAPTVVVGFRLNDSERALRQIGRLQQFLGDQLAAHPHLQPFGDRLERRELGDGQLISFFVQGADIPWDQILEEVEEEHEREMVVKIRDTLQPLRLTMSLGVVRGYLVWSIGPGTEHLAQLGRGPLLADREELQVLRAHEDKPIWDVGYVSKNFLAQLLENSRGQIDQSVQLLSAGLQQAAAVPESLREEINKDAAKLAEVWKGAIPDAGAKLSFRYATQQGYEGYSYNWTENLFLDGSKPLTLLSHVGRKPLVVGVARGKTDTEAINGLITAVERADYYAQEILKLRSEDGWQTYLQVRAELVPFARQLRDTLRNKLVPAFQDGQSAVVLDAGSAARQWHAAMPTATDPLPMLRLALVIGTSDGALAREAFAEMFDVVQRTYARLLELSPNRDEIPIREIPHPNIEEHDDYEIFSYNLPMQLGLDASRIAPNMGLSQRVMVLSLFPEQTRELLEAGKSPMPEDWSTAERPLAAASYVDFGGIIAAIEPWVDYAAGLLRERLPDDNAQQTFSQLALNQIHATLDVLKAFRTRTSVTYVEDDAVVTHFRMVVQDIP